VSLPSVQIPVLQEGRALPHPATIYVSESDVTVLVEKSALVYPRTAVIQQLLNHCYEANTVLQDHLPYEVKTFQLLSALKKLGVFGRRAAGRAA
jgi:hypothetical protein